MPIPSNRRGFLAQSAAISTLAATAAGLRGEDKSAPLAAPRTTLTDSKLPFTRPEKNYLLLARGDVEMAVVDNEAVDDAVLREHRAGYSGVGLLRHARRKENLFVPNYAGLNFEHILDGRAESERTKQFEPRHSPMQLRRVAEHAVELYQPPSFYHALESCQRYELLADGVIQLSIEVIPRKRSFVNDYICLFWASYIHAPESTDIHFLGQTPGAAGAARAEDATAAPQWIRATTGEHGKQSTHLAVDDPRRPVHDEPFPLTLVYSYSPHRYRRPWYYGVSHGMCLVQMFRPQDRVRFSQSPSGGGAGNPAWDFQFLIEKYELDRPYRFVMRAAYAPFESAEQVERIATPHLAELTRMSDAR